MADGLAAQLQSFIECPSSSIKLCRERACARRFSAGPSCNVRSASLHLVLCFSASLLACEAPSVSSREKVAESRVLSALERSL